ncbi:MAG: hypothetical protein QOG99_2149, partial [Frankiales bacterium]|nr:hypothetical protein [Frankiales bacterium]
MDFSVSDDQRELVSSTRRLLARSSPIASVRTIAESGGAGFDPAVWKQGCDLGWAALLVPESHGGLGRDLTDLLLIAEEWGRSVQPGPLIGTAVATVAIAESGRAALMAEALPRLATGESTATWALAEPGGEWDAASVSMQAVGHDDGYVLHGTKTQVPDADTADWLVVTTRLDGDPAQFLVPRGTAGLSVRRLVTLDITRRLDEVTFDHVWIPSSALLSGLVPAALAVERQLQVGEVLVSADSVGVAARLLEMSVDYAKLRVQFGR